MKIFIDTANIEEIKTANEWGIIDGNYKSNTCRKRGKGF
jgi:hypothetical protein